MRTYQANLPRPRRAAPVGPMVFAAFVAGILIGWLSLIAAGVTLPL